MNTSARTFSPGLPQPQIAAVSSTGGQLPPLFDLCLMESPGSSSSICQDGGELGRSARSKSCDEKSKISKFQPTATVPTRRPILARRPFTIWPKTPCDPPTQARHTAAVQQPPVYIVRRPSDVFRVPDEGPMSSWRCLADLRLRKRIVMRGQAKNHTFIARVVPTLLQAVHFGQPKS